MERATRKSIKKPSLILNREEKNKLISDIQDFFYNERDEQIGVITAEIVLDFFLENLGNKVYNNALQDAKLWFSKKMEDMDLDFDLLQK